MSDRPNWDRQFAETEQERNERQAARRRAGNSKLVHDKAKSTIVTERISRRVTAGPYTLELPANGVAILHEADGAGVDHQLPGGVGYLEALVQFAGEVVRLQAMVGQMQTDRADQDVAIRDAIRETASTADELAFWKYQAIWHRAMMLHGRPGPGQTLLLEESRVWKEAISQLEGARTEENRERIVGVK